MKVNRILAAVLIPLLLLTGCQTPPEDSPLPPDAPEETGAAEVSNESNPPPPGSGEGSRPLRLADEITVVTVPEAPSGSGFFLTCWDGETLWGQFRYTQMARDTLAEALPEVRGWAVLEEDFRPVPEDSSLPVYGLRVCSTERDFEAACCGRVWVDNQGHVLSLSAPPELPALWERLAHDPKAQDLRLQPALRELGMPAGTWDHTHFLIQRTHIISEEVPMTLRVTEDNRLSWTIANHLDTDIFHGNGSHAAPEVLLDGAWYEVPIRSDNHYGWTLEGLTTRPRETYSGRLWLEPYGPLPDGDYRLVFDFLPGSGEEPYTPGSQCYAAAPFTVQDGQFLIPDP